MPQSENSAKATVHKPSLERIRRLCLQVWAVIGIVLLVGGAAWVLSKVWTAIVIVLVSALLVFILRAPVAWLEKHKVPRGLGAAIAYVGSFLLIALILLIFIPLIWEQFIELLMLIPGYITQTSNSFTNLYNEYSYLLQDSNINQVVGSLASQASSFVANLAGRAGGFAFDFGTNVVTAVVVLFLSLVVGFWVLMDLPAISRELLVLIGPKRREDARFISSACSQALGGYLKGMVVAGTCTGIISGIGYSLIGLPYPAVLGLLTGLMNFIPFVGPWISGIVVALIGLYMSPLIALLAIVVTVAAQQITDNFITPRVMSTVVELHPAIVLIGVFAGGASGGVLGLIAAIPILAAAKSIFVYYFERRTGRKLVSLKGAFFRSKHADADGQAMGEAAVDPVADATDGELTEQEIEDQKEKAKDDRK
ncbi:MAG: AI-2E family transporter [Coriobacteriales bacterium]|jgi:predicted PurR-regulated permease PerM|nr:AI-2E family transporter [Coriobacteriales bacterium]